MTTKLETLTTALDTRIFRIRCWAAYFEGYGFDAPATTDGPIQPQCPGECPEA